MKILRVLYFAAIRFLKLIAIGVCCGLAIGIVLSIVIGICEIVSLYIDGCYLTASGIVLVLILFICGLIGWADVEKEDDRLEDIQKRLSK
jgi:hypothetical protein